MKKLTVSILAMIMALTLLCSCGKSVVGKWEASQDGVTATYEFKKDGSCSLSAMGMTFSGTYKADGNKLDITVSVMGESDTQTLYYEINGNTLKMADEEDMSDAIEFKKAK